MSHSLSEGVYTVLNNNTQLYLDNKYALIAEGNPIITHPKNGTGAQVWSVKQVQGADDTYTLQNGDATMYVNTENHNPGAGAVLSANKENFVIVTVQGSPNVFRIKPTNTTSLQGGAADWDQVTVRTNNISETKQTWKFVPMPTKR